ncbi:MAG TPA: exo-alpha-sialidase [Planctomycetaceae bacterium]|nr:exo-alpha-sialidase [Planctomycetaceae bacterium]
MVTWLHSDHPRCWPPRNTLPETGFPGLCRLAIWSARAASPPIAVGVRTADKQQHLRLSATFERLPVQGSVSPVEIASSRELSFARWPGYSFQRLAHGQPGLAACPRGRRTTQSQSRQPVITAAGWNRPCVHSMGLTRMRRNTLIAALAPVLIVVTVRFSPLCATLGVLVLAPLAPGAGPHSPPVEILNLPGAGTDPGKIDYADLPRIQGVHTVISRAMLSAVSSGRARADLHDLRFQLHNYLAYYGGRFWCIWSDGPPIEDEPTQEVRYATSDDGLTWSEPKPVTGTPPAPYAFIARGLWVRHGQLLALVAHFKGKGAFGADKELELWAYAWDDRSGLWRFEQKVYDDAINNFPPQKLPSGDWILTRRDARFNVSVLIGGRRALDDWQAFPLVGADQVPGFRPDEPIFWTLSDNKTLFALFRDNGGSERLFHSTSPDLGRSWSKPVMTNFPNATSKLFSMETSRGYRVLVLNANPRAGRRQLHVAMSRDGRTFTRLALLAVPSPPKDEAVSSVGLRKKFQTGIATLQYPHVIEHDGHLLIAFSRNKKETELLRVPLDALDRLLNTCASRGHSGPLHPFLGAGRRRGWLR